MDVTLSRFYRTPVVLYLFLRYFFKRILLKSCTKYIMKKQQTNTQHIPYCSLSLTTFKPPLIKVMFSVLTWPLVYTFFIKVILWGFCKVNVATQTVTEEVVVQSFILMKNPLNNIIVNNNTLFFGIKGWGL